MIQERKGKSMVLWNIKVTDENVEQVIREKYKNIPEGKFLIGSEDFKAYTGKEGMIKYEIQFIKECIKRFGDE